MRSLRPLLLLRRGGRQRRLSTSERPRVLPSDGKTLGSFLRGAREAEREEKHEEKHEGQHYLAQANMLSDERRTFRLETYGCQMNVSDSEVVRAVLRHRQRVDVLEGDAQVEGHDAEEVPPLDGDDLQRRVEGRDLDRGARHRAREQQEAEEDEDLGEKG